VEHLTVNFEFLDCPIPRRLQAVDALAFARTGRSPRCVAGSPRSDSQDELGEPDLGRAPRTHGELLRLGIEIGETSVGKYMARRRDPPRWRTFLENHVKDLVSVDFFTVPTIRFQILYVFLVLAHDGRSILHFNVTAHPTAEWTAQQLVQAFPWDSAPRYLLRDRDSIFGGEFVQRVRAMGIQEVLSAPRSPWQRAFVERVIGTIRRECLDHSIVFDEASLRRMRKTRRSRAWSSRRERVGALPSHRSAVCTIATNDAPLELRDEVFFNNRDARARTQFSLSL
jgi:transposase InsO family protein